MGFYSTAYCFLRYITLAAALFFIPLLTGGCSAAVGGAPAEMIVPHRDAWGIYELDRASGEVSLIYSSPDEIQASALRLSTDGRELVFARNTGGEADENLEIYSLEIGGSPVRLTDNGFMDVYPAWSPDGRSIAFLSLRGKDLDIYVMDKDGGNQRKLFDSGSHDGDIDWLGNSIVFTSQFSIWKISADGTGPVRVTDPPGRGEWGAANLPAGDYDPRLSPDGKEVVFERLVDTSVPNGGYDIYLAGATGGGEKRLTDTGYSQGLANWSHSGEELVYLVAAIGGQGRYDIYVMNRDGSENRNITPAYFPANFLCHSPVFSADDSKILFIGQWWE
jgi:dipeptidyl aminopeptidase/acylaminoacyl peptidase